VLWLGQEGEYYGTLTRDGWWLCPHPHRRLTAIRNDVEVLMVSTW
jgi:hypothetical protein